MNKKEYKDMYGGNTTKLSAMDALTRIAKKYENYPNNLQKYHTPFYLCYDIMDKISAEVKDKDVKELTYLTVNLEFVEVLLYDYGVAKGNIWFLTDCKEKSLICQLSRYNGVNVIVGDFLNWESNMKFDCVVMNPPFQSPKKEFKGRGKSGSSLWDKFVIKAIDLTKDNGYISAIHPSKWRKPTDKLWPLMSANQIHYLEIHNVADGIQTFGCQSRYDWYVMQKCPPFKKTVIKDQEGIMIKMDLKGAKFVPNARIDQIMSLVAKDGEEKCEVLWDCAYHHQTRISSGTMSKEKHGNFIHPCVYAISSKGIVTTFYSNFNDKGHFGVPKVIFAGGSAESTYFLTDEKGEYGMTEFAHGIVDEAKNLPLIQKALSSKEFKDLSRYFAMSSIKMDKDIISCFRKDFYISFL